MRRGRKTGSSIFPGIGLFSDSQGVGAGRSLTWPVHVNITPSFWIVTQNAYKSLAQINTQSKMSELHNLQNGCKAFHLCIWWDELYFPLAWRSVEKWLGCSILSYSLCFSGSYECLLLLGPCVSFSSVCVVCAISAFTLPIETKGRALQVSDGEFKYSPLTKGNELGVWKFF